MANGETKSKTSKEILRGAAQVIRERGHVKGHFKGPDGFCAVGALRQADGYYDSYVGYSEAMTEARECIESLIGDKLIEWNDQEERTAAEVIDALERAAASCT